MFSSDKDTLLQSKDYVREMVACTPPLTESDEAALDIPRRLTDEFGDQAYMLVSELLSEPGYVSKNTQLLTIVERLGFFGDGVSTWFVNWSEQHIRACQQDVDVCCSLISANMSWNSFWREADYYTSLDRLADFCGQLPILTQVFQPSNGILIQAPTTRSEQEKTIEQALISLGRQKKRLSRWKVNKTRFDQSKLLVDDGVVLTVRRFEEENPPNALGLSLKSDSGIKWLLAKEFVPSLQNAARRIQVEIPSQVNERTASVDLFFETADEITVCKRISWLN